MGKSAATWRGAMGSPPCTGATPRPLQSGCAWLRLLVVKQLYSWSCAATLERVADSVGVRWFCRVDFRRAPDATTVLRWARTIRPTTLQALLDRLARLATLATLTHARKLRVDATVVEPPIHDPTASGLFADGVRMLSRLVARAKPLLHVLHASRSSQRSVGRNRVRAMRRPLQALSRVVRRQSHTAVAQHRPLYERLLQIPEQPRQQARIIRRALDQRALDHVADPGGSGESRPAPPAPPPPSAAAADRLRAELDRFLPLVARVIHQARSRVLDEQPVLAQAKLVSLFAPHTRVLRRHKTGTPVEFGRHVVRDGVDGVDGVDAVDGGIVTRYRVRGPGEVERHEWAHQRAHQRAHQWALFGNAAHRVTADHGFHVTGQKIAVPAVGVRHVVVPTSGRATTQQRAQERTRAWKCRSRWRAGIAGRIHRLRRDYGLARNRSHGEAGLLRDVGWGVLASDLHHLAGATAKRELVTHQRAA